MGALVNGLTCTPNPCPPVALCQNVSIDGQGTCVSTSVGAASFDNGSFNPAGGTVTFTVSPPGPYPPGVTQVTLTVTNAAGVSSTCSATVTVLGSDCNGNGILDSCECFWNNGPTSMTMQGPSNGQLSHIGGGAGFGQRVADDFYVCPGQAHHIYGFCGSMVTNTIPELRKARLDFFEDCNGAPARTAFKSYTNSRVVGTTPGAGGFDLVKYCFDFCDDSLWLEGGRTYWVSLVGLSDGLGVDASYWEATMPGASMIGSIPVKGVAGYGSPIPWGPWASIAQCCIGCVNLVYELRGESCPIIWNNGGPDLGMGRGGSPSMDFGGGVRVRTADDFVTRTCIPQTICLIEAWIWTDCEPVIGFLEVYNNECAVASGDRIAGNLPDGTSLVLTPTRIIATGDTALIDGRLRNGYKLQFFGPSMPTLVSGRTYWLSAGIRNAGNISGRGYFAYAADCHSSCLVQLSPGVTRQIVTGQEPWVATTRDYAFRIATKMPPRQMDGLPGSLTPHPCPVDMNGNNLADVQDIFEYLAAWFAGCP